MADTTPLDFDPFDGDFGCPGDTTLKDAMVKARKPHTCTHCAGPIVSGETYRSRSDIVEGDLMSWKWCALCCTAMLDQMAVNDEEDSEPGYPFDARATSLETSHG